MRQVQKKLRIAVLYGGRSAEREISIRTGEQIIKHLDRKKYQVVPSEIPVRGNDWISRLMRNKPDVALLALHGPKLTHLIQKTALQTHRACTKMTRHLLRFAKSARKGLGNPFQARISAIAPVSISAVIIAVLILLLLAFFYWLFFTPTFAIERINIRT